jgi:putative nucleotidyltransferase with HDIG domain
VTQGMQPDQALQDTHRAELMGRLLSLSGTLNRLSSVPGVAASIGSAALTLSGAQRAAVYLRDPDGIVTCPWAQGLSSQYTAQLVTPTGTHPWAHLARRPELACMDLPKRRRAQSPEPTLIPDIRTLPAGNHVRRLAEREGYRALGVWPLTHEGRVRAAVVCYYDAPHTWPPPEAEVMQTFAWQAATALENAELYEARGQKTAELEALYDLSSRLRTARTAEEIYPVLVERAMRLLRADHGALAVLDPGGETFTWAHTAGVAAEAPGSTFPAAGSLPGGVVRTGQPFLTDDLAQEALPDRHPARRDAARELGPLAVVALQSDRDAIGTLAVGRLRGEHSRGFSAPDVRLLRGIAEMGGAAIYRNRLHQHLEEAYLQTVLALARAMDARDAYTRDHSERLAAWAEAVAHTLGCREEEIQDIRWGALLHDIGKIGVPDGILRKPGALTDEEWGTMRQHPVIGEQILLPVERMQGVARIVRHHHEKWDGTGYPDGLRGEAIPLGARVLAAVDAYGAITDERPYKQARSHEDGIHELRRCAGQQFDPEIVDAFCRLLERAPAPRSQVHLFA